MCMIISGIAPDGRPFTVFQCRCDPDERMAALMQAQNDADRREWELDLLGESAIDRDILVDEYCENFDGETVDEYAELHPAIHDEDSDA